MKLISNYAVKLKYRTKFTTDIQNQVLFIFEILHNILFDQKKLIFSTIIFIRSNVFDLACVCCTHMLKHAHTAASSKLLKTKLKNSELVFSGELWTSHGRDGTMEERGGILFLFWLKSSFFSFFIDATAAGNVLRCSAGVRLGNKLLN